MEWKLHLAVFRKPRSVEGHEKTVTRSVTFPRSSDQLGGSPRNESIHQLFGGDERPDSNECFIVADYDIYQRAISSVRLVSTVLFT